MIDYQLEEDEGIVLFSEEDDDVEVYDKDQNSLRIDRVLLTNRNIIFRRIVGNKNHLIKFH